MKKLLPTFVVGVFALGFSSGVLADIATNNVLDGVVQNFLTESGRWESLITRYAQNLFWILALIELAWVAITLGLGKEDWTSALGTIVRTFLVIGFFWVLVVNGFAWATSIVDSLRQIGAESAAVSGAQPNLAPSDIVEIGIIISGRLMSEVGVTPSSWGLIFPAVIITIAFAVIAAEMVLVLVESYLVLTGGIIFLGFGASRFTNNFAINYFKYALGVGVKLMMMQFLIAVAWGILFQWGADYEVNNTQTLVILVASVVIAILVSRLPGIASALINGSAFGSGLSVGNTASAAMGAVTGAVAGAAAGGAAAAGAGMAVNEASKLASASGASGMSMVTQTMANLASAASSDIGGQLAGNQANQHGTAGARMAGSMEAQRMAMVDDDESGDSMSSGSDESGSNAEYQSPLNDN